MQDYVQAHREERQFWQTKVQTVAGRLSPDAAAGALDLELWRYFEERSRVAREFKEFVSREGTRRTSMRNLAEYWLRLWVQPAPKRVTKPVREDF